MKVVERFLSNRHIIVRNMQLTKCILLFFATLALFVGLNPCKGKVRNEDFTKRNIRYENINFTELDYPNFFEIDGNFMYETKPERSDRETILVRGYKKDIDFFKILAAAANKSGIERRNFRFILSDTSERIKSSSVFCELFFTVSDEFKIYNPILSQFMPNSDFFFQTVEFFHQKIDFRINDLIFHHNFDHTPNFIHIMVQKDVKILMRYLRTISNADSFVFGSSFYFTYEDYIFNFIFFLPFFILMALFYAFDALIFDYQLRFPWGLSYLISPVFCFLFIFDENIQMVFNILFFMSINFKIAFLYTVMVYFRAIKEVICMKTKKNKKS